MEIQTLHLLEGARQARGLTVIIDVFRAYSLECYLYALGARAVWPTGSVEEAWAIKNAHPDFVLAGERGGRKCDGFDFGNSPSAVTQGRVRGRTVIHTTSAGTQGAVQAVHAGRLLAGSLVNASATAAYIRAQAPETVSLVCMGNAGVRPAPEDELCAQYLKSLLLGAPLDIGKRVRALRTEGGAHFFDPARQEIFPEADFHLCTLVDRFDFVLEIARTPEGLRTLKIDPQRA